MREWPQGGNDGTLGCLTGAQGHQGCATQCLREYKSMRWRPCCRRMGWEMKEVGTLAG